MLNLKEIVKIYAKSMCLDRNVRWLLFTLAEYIYFTAFSEMIFGGRRVKF